MDSDFSRTELVVLITVLLAVIIGGVWYLAAVAARDSQSRENYTKKLIECEQRWTPDCRKMLND